MLQKFFMKSFANPSQQKTKIAGILKGLGDDNEMLQYQSVMDLSDLLSLATEDTMRNFQVDAFVPLLVKFLDYEHNPDMMIFTIRCLNYLLEALPNAGGSLVSHGVIPKFCDMLLSLQFIDIAENIFQVLEKLSYEHGTAILKAKGLEAALNALDFFPVETQLVAVRLVANVCRHIVPENWVHLSPETLMILAGLVSIDRDRKVLEQGILCFSRLADNNFGDAVKIKTLADCGIVSSLARILAAEKSSVSAPSFTTVVRLLSTLVLSYPDLAKTYFQEGMVEIVGSILQNTPNDANDRLIEVLALLAELLPPMPEDMTTLLSNLRTPPRKNSNQNSTQKKDPRPEMMTSHPQFLTQLGKQLLDPLIQLFLASVNFAVRQKALAIIAKFIHYATASMLKEVLRDIPFSSLLASLLNGTAEPTSVALALKISEILLKKLPEIFLLHFAREGVVAELEILAKKPAVKRGPKSKTENSSSPSFSLFGVNSPTRQDSVELENWIIKQAKAIQSAHLHKRAVESQVLKQLKALSVQLRDCASGASSEEKSALQDLAQILVAPEGVTSYELLQSDIVDSLLNYLTSVGSQAPLQAQDLRVLEERARLFTAVFCGHALVVEKEALQSPFLLLVRKLQNALNSTEAFPVILSETSSVPQTLKSLTQPIKIQFIKDSKDQKYERWGGNYTMIEPLANVSAMERFLLPRISCKNDDLSLASLIPEKKLNEISKKIASSSSSEEDYEEEDDDDDDEEEEEEPMRKPLAISSEIPRFDELGMKLTFKIGDTVLDPKQTIFKALQNQMCLASGQMGPFPLRKMWDNVHTISYFAENQNKNTASDNVPLCPLDSTYVKQLKRAFPFDPALPSSKMLKLLSILEYFNRNWFEFSTSALQSGVLIPTIEFVNKKLTGKLNKQFQDPMALCSGATPDWCTNLARYCEFLFTVETRTLFFQCTSGFGIARGLNALNLFTQIVGRNNHQEIKAGRIPRQKVRVAREPILESAIKVMELYGKSKAILEVEYFNEVGTGLGPTLEFFTLASQELQKANLELWKSHKKSDSEFVLTNKGLFPAPIGASQTGPRTEEKIRYFTFAGRLVAKSLLDSRLLDLRFSTAFLKWMTGRQNELTFSDLAEIDPGLAQTLQQLKDAVLKKKDIDSNQVLSVEEKKRQLDHYSQTTFNPESLMLDFTLFGNVELKPHGAEIDLTFDNLEEYLNLVVQYYLDTGVKPFLNAFKAGFDEVFPMESCACFSVSELSTLMCGLEMIEWDMQTLVDSTTCSHGHLHTSKVVQWFFETLIEMDQSQRRQFVLFITGSASLPAGGLKNLGGKLSIVRKEPESKNVTADDMLPSVNTCFLFIKLPDYSSKEILTEKLFMAIYGTTGFQMN